MIQDSPETKWRFTCPTDGTDRPPAGGLVLQDVTHDGHNFARDIRMIGLWIEIEEVDAAGRVTAAHDHPRLLDAPFGFAASPIRALEPKPVTRTVQVPIVAGPAEVLKGELTGRPVPFKTRPVQRVFQYLKDVDDALYFAKYFKDPGDNYVASGVAASFDAPDVFARLNCANCAHAGLTIEQVFLFSRYANTPSHEPSGALTAARFHPLVRYTLRPNPAFDPKQPYTRVGSIRFDFRLHLYVDAHYADIEVPKGTGNQAGLFADQDSFAAVAHGVERRFGLSGEDFAQAVSESAFAAVEKPVVLEVTAPALVKGFPDTGLLAPGEFDRTLRGDIVCWDNVHWWGARAPGMPLIAAPGGFHAAHVHWRWGAGAREGNPPVTAPGPPYNPGTWPQELGTRKFAPLVDPGIFMQTINVAITKNGPRLDPAKQSLSDLTDSIWQNTFETGTPAVIEEGADIVLWYSTRVHRTVTVKGSAVGQDAATTFTAAPGGAVFLHGIFFAHDDQPPSSLTIGSNDPQHSPRSEEEIRKAPRWNRPAKSDR